MPTVVNTDTTAQINNTAWMMFSIRYRRVRAAISPSSAAELLSDVVLTVLIVSSVIQSHQQHSWEPLPLAEPSFQDRTVTRRRVP